EGIEEVHAETHTEPLLERPVLRKLQVGIHVVRTVTCAPRRIADSPKLHPIQRERVWIEDLETGYTGSARNTRIDVWTLVVAVPSAAKRIQRTREDGSLVAAVQLISGRIQESRGLA